MTQRQKTIEQQYKRRHSLNLQSNVHRKVSHQQRLVYLQHTEQLRQRQAWQQAIEEINA